MISVPKSGRNYVCFVFRHETVGEKRNSDTYHTPLHCSPPPPVFLGGRGGISNPNPNPETPNAIKVGIIVPDPRYFISIQASPFGMWFA